MSAASCSHYIVSVPLDPKSTRTPVERYRTAMVEKFGRELGAMHPFKLPQFRVGSLDSLVSLTDELARVDTFVEGVFKKAERLVTESYVALAISKYLSDKVGHDLSGMPPIKPQPFYFNGKAVHVYLNNVEWDSEEWDPKEALPSLTRRILASAEKLDQDLRTCSSTYQEKKTALQAAERKKGGNYLVSPLEDVITSKSLKAANAEWVAGDASEFFASVVVVVTSAQEEGFLLTYSTLGDKAVPLGPAGGREKVRGSPVIPRSARRIAQDSEGYVLYTLLVLKPYMDSFRTAAKERRWGVRDFAFVEGAAGGGERAVGEATREVESALLVLKEVSRRRYEEALMHWMHIKMLRVHVDSVLRYGLPVNYCATLVLPQKGEGGKVVECMREAWKLIAGASGEFDAMYAPPPLKPMDEDDDQAVGPDPVIPGVTEGGGGAGGGGGAEAGGVLPFILFDFDVKPDTEAASGGSK